MDRDELILQKLEEMEARQRERDAMLESRLTKIESEMKEDVKDIRAQLTMVLKDNAELKVNQTKLEGDLHSVDFKLTGKLETLEMKLDNFITNVHERKN